MDSYTMNIKRIKLHMWKEKEGLTGRTAKGRSEIHGGHASISVVSMKQDLGSVFFNLRSQMPPIMYVLFIW